MAWINGVIMGPYHLDSMIQSREEDTATSLQLPHRHNHHHHHHHHHQSVQGFVSSCNSSSLPKARPSRGLNKRALGRYSIKDENAFNDEELLYNLSDHDLIDDMTTNDNNPSEKRRRLTMQQVNFLEMSFNNDLKLEPDRKTEIAKQLGIRPRQVAIWFQNRRARWKNKQLEQDYDALKANYEALIKDNDTRAKEHGAIVEENMRLLAEVSRLKSLLEKQEINILSDDALLVKREEETSGKSELTYYSPIKYSCEDQSDDSGQSNESQPSLDEEEELNPSIKIEEEGEGDDLHLVKSDDILLIHQFATTHGNGMTCINEDAYSIFNSCEDQLGGFPSWYG